METIKVKSGVRTEKLTLAKQVKSGRWAHIAKPISKGTEVEVTINTDNYKDIYYTVKHPSCLGINIIVDQTYFKFSQEKAKLKVDDEFWFASIYSMNVWKDKIIKITSRYAYFKCYPNKTGIYKIDLYYFSSPSKMSNVDIHIDATNGYDGMNDFVTVSKNKVDVQKDLLILIVKLKVDKEKVIDKIVKEHVDKIKEYQALEEKEAEIIKEMNL